MKVFFKILMAFLVFLLVVAIFFIAISQLV